MTDSDIPNPNRQYIWRASLLMIFYVVVNVAAIFGVFDQTRGVGAWVLGLVVAAPIVGHIWVLLICMRDSDEYLRGMLAKRFIISAGVAMAVYTTWGFLELYAHAPHVQGAFIFPLFWMAFAVVSPFIRRTGV